jgi:hypothetical protein
MPHSDAGRRALQAAVAVLSLIPISAGLAGVLMGPAAFGDPAGSWAAGLDSHVRFLSGIFLALGLVFLSTVARIERQGPRFRLAAGAVVVGGLARAWSLAVAGVPDWPHLAGLGMELVVVPLLVVWQARVARAVG